MSNNNGITVKNDNLKPWQPGQSGNPAGRPKGSRNISGIIRDLLNDSSIYERLTDWNYANTSNTPIEAIVLTLISKAIDGDSKSAEILFKYGFEKSPDGSEEVVNVALVQFMEPITP